MTQLDPNRTPDTPRQGHPVDARDTRQGRPGVRSLWLVIISAGFDAHRRDPLADLRLDAEDFGWATGKLMEIADRRANGRLISVLEGGYDLEALAASAATHVRRLMGS